MVFDLIASTEEEKEICREEERKKFSFHYLTNNMVTESLWYEHDDALEDSGK